VSSDDRYRALLASAPDAMIVVADGRVAFVNVQACRLFGYREDELLGKAVEALVPEMALLRPEQGGDDHGAVGTRVVCRRKDGSELPAEINLSTVRTDEGAYTIAAIRDVTSRIEMENALHKREQQLREVQEVAHLGSWEWHVQTDRIVWSDELHRIYGTSPDRSPCTLRAFVERIHPDDRAAVRTRTRAALDERRAIDHEFRIVRDDGSVRVLHSRGAVQVDAQGNPVRLLGTSQDVTERHSSEQALRASEERFRRIVEAAVEGIWIIDAQGLTTFVNPHMAAMLGYSVAEMLARPLASFMDDASQRRFTEYLAKRRRGLNENNEFRFERKDGQDLWALLATSPIQDATGCYEGALVMAADVTEQKKMQARLLIADRMVSIGTLAAGVAHEINNPLAALIGNLELLMSELGSDGDAGSASSRGGERDPLPASVDSSDVRQLLREAREASERVRQIVRDLKIFSRPEEEKRVAVDVRRVLESSLRMAWNEIRHRARLVKDHQSVPLVDANEGRLGQVFLNLIINAAQAIPEGHADENEIRIVTRVAPDGRVMIEIRDTGPGISPEILVHIFDPFFTTKPIGVGTGLGLAICQRIINELGGDIWVETEVGRGSIFRIALPVYKVKDVVAFEESGPAVLSSRRGRVLVIDDEPLVRTFLGRALSPDHDVTVESHAEEALAHIRAGTRFDVILCDVMMPQMTGIDLYNAILRIAPDQAARMIFVTGGAFTGRAQDFLHKTPNAHIEKPFEVRKLRSMVSERVRSVRQ
jgi:PAS domain S-box-containing protein